MPIFYSPRIQYQKYINNKLKVYEKNILDNYLICKHEKFSDTKIINSLKNSKGLIYFLNGYQFNQSELEEFIRFCKLNEDKKGFLTQSFFKIIEKTKARFISGPFTQMVFDIIEKEGSKLKILMNNINITIPKNSSKFLYSSI